MVFTFHVFFLCPHINSVNQGKPVIYLQRSYDATDNYFFGVKIALLMHACTIALSIHYIQLSGQLAVS